MTPHLPAQPLPTLSQLAARWEPSEITLAIATANIGKVLIPPDNERWYIAFVATQAGTYVTPFSVTTLASLPGYPVPIAAPYLSFDYPTSGNICQLGWILAGGNLGVSLRVIMNAWRRR